MLIDSHCHLEYDGLVERRDAVLEAARSAGVRGFLNISTRRSEWVKVVATAHDVSDVWASIGIHPHHADEHMELTFETLIEAAADPRVIGLGETGLDYYYAHSERNAQERLFRLHIAVSRTTGLPLIIHTRDAEDDTLRILTEEMGKGAFPGLIHCFTASATFGHAVVALGLSVSVSGIVTFKNARDLQEFVATVPADRLLVETDAPFLAPVPHRGKTCEPAFVADTARHVAALRGERLENLAAATSANFFRLFAKAAPARFLPQ